MKHLARTRLDSRGVTLTELMVAMAIVTIGVVAAMSSFKFISQALSQSRLKTIATNLAQERMEVLKNKSYFQLLVTTSPTTSSGYNPNFVYDNGNYPPETITLWGGAPLTRVVEVDYASVSGTSVSTVAYTSNDPGVKKITVYVFWTERGTPKKIELDSYYANPNVATLDTSFKGTVTINGSASALPGALVQVIGTPKWRGYSDAGGNYSFQVAPGTYSLVCSSSGFFTQYSSPLGIAEGTPVTANFSLTAIATGTVRSDSLYARSPSLVISQVVASTVQADTFDAQYVELFNPTTSAIDIGTSLSHSIRLNIISTCGTPRTCLDVNLVYVSTYVPPGQYYLIANRSSFTVLGTNYTADAYYTDSANSTCSPSPADWAAPGVKRLVQVGHNGAVWLTDSGGTTIDAVGWNHHLNAPPAQCETACIPFNGGGSTIGLLATDQVVRFSTACTVGNTYGRAYDTDDNPNNFYYNNSGSAVGLIYNPFSSTNPPQTVLSGRPSTSAYIFADDGNSAAAQASSYYAAGSQGQSCLVSSATLVGVATGTWNVSALAGNYTQTISNVSVAQGAATKIPNAATSPAWPLAGFNYMALTSAGAGGLATGYVYGAGPAYSSRLSGILVGSQSGGSGRTDSQGFYVISLSTGTATITANYNSDNGNYTTSDAIADITQGAATTVPDFHLGQGGYIKGYATSGTGALPNIAVHATNGGAVYQDTSDHTGYFYIFVATSATAYTVTPDLDPLQSFTSLPTNPLTSVVSTPGSSVFAGTITVVGALGTITGSVKNNGTAITTGVLVVASTAAVTDPLASVVASSSPALAIFYSISSQSDGTYSLDVRSSTTSTYNVRAFYPVVNPQTGAVSYTSKTKSGLSVGAGTTLSAQDFAWP